jgi:Fe-S oxidoreductase
MVSMLAFTVCLVVGVGLFIRQIRGRFNLLRAAQGGFSIGDVWARLRDTLEIAIGQKKFLRPSTARMGEGVAGWMHALLFWGFMILGVQVVQMFARAYAPGFSVFAVPGLHLLEGPYVLVKDLFQAIVLGAVIVALGRWLVTQPRRLFGFGPAEDRLRSHSHWEAYLILSFIGAIMVGGFLYDGGRIALHAGDPHVETEARWSVLSAGIGRLLAGAGVARGASDFGWWLHNLVVLTFLNFLPLAKHFHVITSLPNVFFRKQEPLGQLSKPDYETAETYGTSRIDHFTWKQVLDMFSCTECGRCSSNCPATATGKPLAPRQMLLDLRDYLYEHQDEIAEKRVYATGDGEKQEVGENIVGSVVEDDVLWACNTCRACEEACPVMIEYVDKIVDMRRHLVQEEARFPTELTRVFKAMESQSNPWGIGAEKRFDWADGMAIPTIADKPDAEYLLYVGCAGAFDDRNKKTTQAFARLLRKAGVDFACLGREELCNGDSARRLGNEYLYQAMAEACVATFKGYEVRKVITNCPHCFNTIKNEFTQFDGEFEVIHAAELLEQLIEAGRLEVPGGFGKRVAYHDSCYYGRFNDVYDEPRTVLAKAGADVHEMHRHKQFGMCCGAGGGRMWIEEDPDKRVNLLRTEQALETNPEVIAVSCPFCMTMLSDGIKAKDLEERIETLDVMEIVERVVK